MNRLIFLLEHGFIRVNIYTQEDKVLRLQKTKLIKLSYPFLLDPIFERSSLIAKITDEVIKDEALDRSLLECSILDKSDGTQMQFDVVDSAIMLDISGAYLVRAQLGEISFKPIKDISINAKFLSPLLENLTKIEAVTLLNYLVYPPFHDQGKLLALLYNRWFDILIETPIELDTIVFTGSFTMYCKDETQVLYALLKHNPVMDSYSVYIDMENIFFETQYLKNSFPSYDVQNSLHLKHIADVYKIEAKKKHAQGDIAGIVSIVNDEEEIKVYPIVGSVMRIPLKMKSTITFHLTHHFTCKDKHYYVCEANDSIVIDCRIGEVTSNNIIDSWYEGLYVNGI